MTRSPDTRLIYNARLVSEHQANERGWLLFQQGKIAHVGEGAVPADMQKTHRHTGLDADGQWLVPGFIDIHVHGADGAEVMDGHPDAIRKIARFHAKYGTTGWLPTTLTASIPALERSLAAIQQVRMAADAADGAAVLGMHLEGPFIAPEKVGAQNPAFIREPSISVLERLTSISPGLIRKVTLAPERSNALDVIRWLTQHDIISSIGHTNGCFADTMHAIDAGATHATHLFNAMSGLHHRDGGTVGACLVSDEVICELIADGHHVDPDVIKLVVKLKGKERIALITDAISATGKPDGQYQLGGLDILVKDGTSILKEGGHLAGSLLTMDAAVRRMVSRVGVSLSDAVVMASTTPARELGLSGCKGTLAIGADADVVILDEAMKVTRTIIQGQDVFVR